MYTMYFVLNQNKFRDIKVYLSRRQDFTIVAY